MVRRPREITEEFSAGMAIINLLARQFSHQLFDLKKKKLLSRGPSTFALWKEWGARGGGGGWPVAGGEVYLYFFLKFFTFSFTFCYQLSLFNVDFPALTF